MTRISAERAIDVLHETRRACTGSSPRIPSRPTITRSDRVTYSAAMSLIESNGASTPSADGGSVTPAIAVRDLVKNFDEVQRRAGR